MRFAHWQRVSSLVAGIAIVGVLGSPVAQAGPDTSITPPDDSVVQVPVLESFLHPVSLEDAVVSSAARDATSRSGTIGYRFEGDVVVGEYWPSTDVTPEKFLGEFERATGTRPEIVGLISIATVPRDEVAEWTTTKTLDTDAPVYAAPIVQNLPEEQARQLGQMRENATAVLQTTTAPYSSSSGGYTVHPRDAYINVRTSSVFANTVQVTQYYDWYGIDPINSPLQIPNHWGMEFGVDLTTELPQYQVGLRPSCWPGFEEATAATNQNFTWWVSLLDGTEYLGAPGPAGFYGDYYDVLDECARTSITVGVADPSEIPFSPYNGGSTLSITILADEGNEATSRVSGNIQAIERYSCEENSGVPLTICMGDNTSLAWPGPGAQSQLTKNTTTVWYAPDRCWYTPEFGSAAYDTGCYMP